MATPFETFVNQELPKRISTSIDPTNVPAGFLFLTTGVGLGVELADPADLTINGKSAYQVAVDNGFEGTSEEWLESLKGQSAFALAQSLGFEGTLQEWLDSLKGLDGKTAFQSAQDQGFEGTEAEWIASLNGSNGQSAFELAQQLGFVGDEAAWLLSLKGTDGQDGQSAYALAVVGGFVGDEAAWIASLHGAAGQDGEPGIQGEDGKSAFAVAQENGFEGTEAEWLTSLKGEPGDELTIEQLQTLLLVRGYSVKTLLKVVGDVSAVDSKSAFHNFMLLFDNRIDQDLTSSNKAPQYIAEQSRMEAEGYSYWKNTNAGGTTGDLPLIPGSEVRLYDTGKFQIGSLSDYVEIGGGSIITVVSGEDSVAYDLSTITSGADGRSAYEVAVANGFEGDEAAWLLSLKGTSAYDLAVELGFVGDEADWIISLKGEAGTSGQDGRSILSGNRNPNTEDGLVGDFFLNIDTYTLFGPKSDVEGSEWTIHSALKGTNGRSLLSGLGSPTAETGEVGDFYIDMSDAVNLPFWGPKTDTVGFEWPPSLHLRGQNGADGKSAFEVAVANGYEGTEPEWLATLKGADGEPGQDGADGSELTTTQLAALLAQRGYTIKNVLKILADDDTASIITRSGWFNYLFLYDPAYASGDLSALDKPPQYMMEAGRVEEFGVSYWKNSPGSHLSSPVPEVPDAEMRLFDDGRFHVGSHTDYIEFGDGSKITIVNPGGSTTYDLANISVGADGKSAYQIALDEGFEGTVEEWLASLHGKSAFQLATDEGFEGDLATWLTSLKGADGQDGAPGLPGDNGTDGRTVLSGTVDPIGADGATGDFYLNTVSCVLFGPKAVIDGSEWAASVSLKGIAGVDGHSILSGAGSPALELGALGDFYIDLDTLHLDFYGPKSETEGAEWPLVTTLKGLDGAVGQSAYQIAVTNGFEGTEVEWLASLKGETGPGGGDTGKSAYELAQDEGFEGTLGEWLTSLVGPTGAAGANGTVIHSGHGLPDDDVGVEGDFYLDLGTGALLGPKAAAMPFYGTTTPLRGADGAAGSVIHSGVGAPSDEVGVEGDYYLDTTAGSLYGPKGTEDSFWTTPLSLKGADGTDGAAGTNGKSILSGFGAPDTDTGNVGDFYIQLDGMILYGPKTADFEQEWSARAVFLEGTDGKSILSGIVAPDAAVGVVGDFFLDTATYLLYGPKVADEGLEWATSVSIKGADGEAGAAGTAGRTILHGTYTPNAEDGVEGDFFLRTDTTVLYGPKTTEPELEWSQSVSLIGTGSDLTQAELITLLQQFTGHVEGVGKVLTLTDESVEWLTPEDKFAAHMAEAGFALNEEGYYIDQGELDPI